MQEKILVVVAHSDDQIIGAGGTIAKYASEDAIVKTIIVFSGEESHFHFQEKIIVNTRMKESLNADKIVGGQGVNFFNFTEMSFKTKEFDSAHSKLNKIIKNFQPTKILSHSNEDSHPGHKKINRLVLTTIEDTKSKAELFVFDIWNPFRFNKRKFPHMVVDIAPFYKTKIKALQCFKSQFSLYGFLNWYVLTIMYLKNFFNGLNHKTRFAEVFYRIK